MPDRLSPASLAQVAPGVTRPAYDRAAVRRGVVHLGVGAFHRAHQAPVLEDCLSRGDTAWGIVGASLRSPDTRDALAPQGGLYALSTRDGSGERLAVVGALQDVIVGPEKPHALLDAIAHPDTRLVTLTVTEKAYLRAPGGALDEAHASLRADLADRLRPSTIYGILAIGLARRRTDGLPPPTVLSCDNLPANGATFHRLFLEYAGHLDRDFGAWAAAEVAFPSSMVDRITPATTDADRDRIAAALGVTDAWPVVTEPFTQWVIEDRFTAGRPDWEPAGVEMVGDVAPYEAMKLRLLNGAHSLIAYLGLLLDQPTVADSFGDPRVRRAVHGLWSEAAGTLAPHLDTAAYTARLTARFDNPALQHRTAQIANDGSQKLPQRALAAAAERLEADASAEHLLLAVAAWLAAAERPRTFSDPLDATLAEVAGAPAAAAVDRVFAATGFPRDRGIPQRVAAHLTALREGVAAHLATLTGDAP